MEGGGNLLPVFSSEFVGLEYDRTSSDGIEVMSNASVG